MKTGFRNTKLRGMPIGLATLVLSAVVSCPSTAMSRQTEATSGSVAAQSRNVPAPWRPSFGALSRKNQAANSNSITTSGTFNTQSTGGLPAPNSPYSNQANNPVNLVSGNSTNVANPSGPGVGVARSQLTNSGSRPVSSVDQSANGNSKLADPNSPFVEPVDQPLPPGTITRVTKTMSKLPNDAGQVWREYDISPYTSRITQVPDPQQAILDWILKETGTEMWFNQPLGILNADKRQLRVYHTPEIQKIVNRIVDRFVNTRGQVQNLEVSLITVGKPNWRETAYRMLQPIDVQSPGVEAWMVSKENAAILRSSLARRGDYKDHGTGKIGQADGQTVVLRNTKPVQFIRNFRWTGNQFPPYQPLITTIDEGYTLELSSLSSIDGKTIEATIACNVDQVEKLNNVRVEVPGTVGATTDKISLQIP
ncbi:MAG: hypothetical protein AAGA30_11430, partial [Planctomycetota bacterium]